MSARKWVLPAYQVVTDGDMSGDLTSVPTGIRYIDSVCYQIAWTGAPVGQFFVDGSNDGKTWSELSFSTKPASGSADSNILDLNQLSFYYVRVRYKRTSGTGTLNIVVGGKSL